MGKVRTRVPVIFGPEIWSIRCYGCLERIITEQEMALIWSIDADFLIEYRIGEHYDKKHKDNSYTNIEVIFCTKDWTDDKDLSSIPRIEDQM